MLKAPPKIQAPEIALPARPAINVQLTYRLELLRVLHRTVLEAKKTQERAANSAFGRAMAWGEEFLINGARMSLNELGPLSKIAVEADLKEFIESLDREDQPTTSA